MARASLLMNFKSISWQKPLLSALLFSGLILPHCAQAANPAPVTIASTGADTMVLSLAEVPNNGDVEFTVSVDGKQIGGTQTVTALRNSGQVQNFTLQGNFGAGNHTVGINFLNDTNGATSAWRYLYVYAITLDGVTKQVNMQQGADGLVNYYVSNTAAAVTAPTSITPAVAINTTGPDVMTLNISEDYYLSDAQFIVLVDGVQIGGTQTAKAIHNEKQTQPFTLQGNFATGTHIVAVDFLNDAWGGTSAADRNLYVDSITLDGVKTASAAPEYWGGMYVYQLSALPVPQIGSYVGPGCNGLPQMNQFNGWLGFTTTHGTENLNQSSWSALMSGVPWELSCYKPLQKTLQLTLGIPMLPADGVSTLANGAKGAYDAYFTGIAQQLVATGYANITLRVGWEFNGNWQPWASYKDPANFIKYYQRIVTLMRAVPGANFKFDWCPNVGLNSLAPDQSYPGDAYVDFIGMDVYDAVWSANDLNVVNRWNWFVAEPYGLQWQVNFARAHNKQLSLPEWGTGGNNAGDDPYFVNGIAQWVKANHYTYLNYWNTNAAYEGLISTGQYPNAAKAFLAAF